MTAAHPWLGRSVVVTSLLLCTVCSGVVFSYSVVVLYLEKDIHASLPLLEWLGALPAGVPLLIAPVVLWLHQRLGSWGTVLSGTVLVAGGLLVAGLVRPPTIGMLFASYGGAVALGIALLVTPPFFLLHDMYPYDHPQHVMVTSLVACGFPLGSLAVGPIANQLLVVIGWQHAYLVLAGMVAICGIAMIIPAIVWNKIKPKKADSESEAGTPQESNENESKEKMSTKRKVAVLILWGVVSLTGNGNTPLVLLVQHMNTIGVPKSLSWHMLPVVGACELLGRLAGASGGDWLKGKLLYMYSLCCVLLSWLFAFATRCETYTHFLLFGAVMGAVNGPITSTLYGCSSEVLGGRKVRLLFSMFKTGTGISNMVGPILAGVFFESLGTFRPVFIFFAICNAIASVVYAAIAVMARKESSPEPSVLPQA